MEEVKTNKVACHTCGKIFPSHKELALHISTTRGHYKGKKWAANYLMKVNSRPEIKRVAENPDYEPTEYGDENRRKAIRETSGEQEYAYTICPNCGRHNHQLLPAEYINDESAWTINGHYVILCQEHQNKFDRG